MTTLHTIPRPVTYSMRVCLTRWLLPYHAGSLLRGVFGASLRDIACTTHQPTCIGCALSAACPYTQVLLALQPSFHRLQEFSNIPNAYVVEPSTQSGPLHYCAGSMLVFGVVLTGAALDQLPLVLFAWHQALQRG
jgi:hypothetical protein